MGVPGATSSPRLGKMVAIWPSSGAVRRESTRREETSSTVLRAASTSCGPRRGPRSALRPRPSGIARRRHVRRLGRLCTWLPSLTPLGGDDTVLIKRYNALVSGLGEGKVALRLVPELPGVATIWRRVPASIFLFCSWATCSRAFTWRYLASMVGLLMTTSVSPAFTQSPSCTRKESTRPGSFPLIRISVASTCPCRTRGCRLMSNMPASEMMTVAARIMTNAMLMLLLLTTQPPYGTL